MSLDTGLLGGLDAALNEATLRDVECDVDHDAANVKLSVWTLPARGAAAAVDVELHLQGVGRVAASLVEAGGNVEQFAIGDLSSVVRSFGGQPIYGWEFFDVQQDALQGWLNRLSLDWWSYSSTGSHTLCLFQEDAQRHLDLAIWFEGLEVHDGSGRIVMLEDFIEAGSRWWKGVQSGDPRTAGKGVRRLDE